MKVRNKLLIKYLIVLVFFLVPTLGGAYGSQASVSASEGEIKNTLTPVIDLGVTFVTTTEIGIAWANTVADINSVSHNIHVSGQLLPINISGTETSYTISGLTPGTEYQIYIVTQSKDTPPLTATSTTITAKTDPVVLQSVHDLRYTSAVGNTINIAWNNPTANPASGIMHTIYVDSTKYATVQGYVTSHEILGRVPGNSYAIYVITELVNDPTVYAQSETIRVTPTRSSYYLSEMFMA